MICIMLRLVSLKPVAILFDALLSRSCEISEQNQAINKTLIRLYWR